VDLAAAALVRVTGVAGTALIVAPIPPASETT